MLLPINPISIFGHPAGLWEGIFQTMANLRAEKRDFKK
jgi:hypothetical protein